MPNELRGMPLPTKMYPFEAEIGSNKDFVSGRNTEHGAVVTDSGDHSELGATLVLSAGILRHQAAYLRNQLSFRKGHGNDDMR